MNQTKPKYHSPAFLNDIISYVEFAKDGNIFDAYGGDGSYGEALLEKFPGIHYYYSDIDKKAVETATKRLIRFGQRAHIERISCAYLEKRVSEEGLSSIDSVIYDPGLRYEYVSNPDRGFSIKLSGPLDGRYDQSAEGTIGDIVNNTPVDELSRIFKTVEIPSPNRIAQRIDEYRKNKKISTTGELADIVEKAVPYRLKRKKVHTGVLAMLALRIHVNDELSTLEMAVKQGFDALRIGGRLITISYHSLEAKIYKRFARAFDERYADDADKRIRVLTRKVVKPTEDAINQNPLIRSAQLRVYEKIF
ncbi:16S rRNA (cytosine(1402)-N(4))-methyltransferase RsmH [bacterium]|nr:16S rRNA (cytosine(1402)-N(4))-methyltransferase RsmH [bacterium]MBU1024412.1 16S rRNA (cytosine(1402)-N(4))-methyltransferase RsmH [bacterium]